MNGVWGVAPKMPRRGGCAVGVALLLSVAACGQTSARTRLQVTPRSASSDLPLSIVARGLPARRAVVVRFSGRSDGALWQGSLHARTDSSGDLVLRDVYPYARMHGTSGSMVWPEQVMVTVRAGEATETATVSRHPLSFDSLKRVDERPASVGFYGEWITPPEARKHTAILMFGGSEGGLFDDTLADTLAAHGYPVLHLAYFGEPGLPRQLKRIPLEYFQRALVWMTEQPQVDPARIVTFGWSRGGEASLLLASTFTRLVYGAVGYVPSAFVFGSPANFRAPAWTYRGRPLAAATRIPIWRSSGPVFVVGGRDDKLWPSGQFTRDIEREMQEHHRRDVTALVYPGAGHELYQAVPPQVVLSPIGYGVVNSAYGVLTFGGSPRADEAGLEDSWPKLLHFLANIGRRS